ncbi:unnamed protein product [Triticum turgidum subsp. durum]|uniref:Uncharacterized protein n=1 Tax=Triticum turgidum subsp. durum TaxID=4567 RepID=A0A9R0Q7V2_TRITD|nr:unnamed protein product [Triticum turgidum subsp. durum]
MASLTVSQTTPAAGNANKQREGAEIITGAEACYEHSKELLKGLGFPGGVMPLRGLDECGLVRETGYVEEGRMKRMTGVRSKQMMLWVPIVEMSLDGADKVYFKSNVGIGRSFPAAAFADEDDPAAAAATEANDKQ